MWTFRILDATCLIQGCGWTKHLTSKSHFSKYLDIAFDRVRVIFSKLTRPKVRNFPGRGSCTRNKVVQRNDCSLCLVGSVASIIVPSCLLFERASHFCDKLVNLVLFCKILYPCLHKNSQQLGGGLSEQDRRLAVAVVVKPARHILVE